MSLKIREPPPTTPAEIAIGFGGTGSWDSMRSYPTAGITSAQEQRHTFRIPFRETHGRIILDIKLDGRPAALLFDTGAAMSFSLVRSGRPLIMVFDHGEPQFETAPPGERCPTIAEPDVRVQGFVGTDVLKRFRTIRIDYKNQVLELEQ